MYHSFFYTSSTAADEAAQRIKQKLGLAHVHQSSDDTEFEVSFQTPDLMDLMTRKTIIQLTWPASYAVNCKDPLTHEQYLKDHTCQEPTCGVILVDDEVCSVCHKPYCSQHLQAVALGATACDHCIQTILPAVAAALEDAGIDPTNAILEQSGVCYFGNDGPPVWTVKLADYLVWLWDCWNDGNIEVYAKTTHDGRCYPAASYVSCASITSADSH